MTELEALKIVRDKAKREGLGSNPGGKEALDLVDALIERVEALEDDPEGKVELAKIVLADVGMLISHYFLLAADSYSPGPKGNVYLLVSSVEPDLREEFYKQLEVHKNSLPKEYEVWLKKVVFAAVKEYKKKSGKDKKSWRRRCGNTNRCSYSVSKRGGA